MNYEELSDFEINKRVAEILARESGDNSILDRVMNEELLRAADNGQFNPCNNPSAAWPIIYENEIDIDWPAPNVCDGTVSIYREGNTDIQIDFEDKSKVFRYAMSAYLMLKESP